MSQLKKYDVDFERVSLLLNVIASCVAHGNQHPYIIAAATRELYTIEDDAGDQIRRESDQSRIVPEPVKQVPNAERVVPETPEPPVVPGTSIQAALPAQAQQTSTILPDGQQVPLAGAQLGRVDPSPDTVLFHENDAQGATVDQRPSPEPLPPSPEPDRKGLDQQPPAALANPVPEIRTDAGQQAPIPERVPEPGAQSLLGEAHNPEPQLQPEPQAHAPSTTDPAPALTPDTPSIRR